MAIRKLKPIEERDPHAAGVLDAFDKLEDGPRMAWFQCRSCGGHFQDDDRWQGHRCGCGGTGRFVSLVTPNVEGNRPPRTNDGQD